MFKCSLRHLDLCVWSHALHTCSYMIYSKFHRYPFRGFGSPGGRNLPVPNYSGLYNSTVQSVTLLLIVCVDCSDPVFTRLLQVKMNIIPYDICRRMRSLINETAHICIGSVPTRDYGICKVSINSFYRATQCWRGIGLCRSPVSNCQSVKSVFYQNG